MMKKNIVIFVLFALVFAFSSCGVKVENNKTNVLHSFTQKQTYIYNNFKDKLPEFNFEKEPVERYRDGMNFTMSVTCSQKDFEKYTKKLKKEGFDQNLVEAQTYFSASSEDGFFVEATYVGDMLTVLVKAI